MEEDANCFVDIDCNQSAAAVGEDEIHDPALDYCHDSHANNHYHDHSTDGEKV